jgi:hypothetical protein
MGSDDSDDDNHDRVLAPDDLDITTQPEVEEIDEGRYVVSPDGPAKKPDRDLLENPDWLSDDDEEDASQPIDSSPPRESRRDQSTPTQSQPDSGSTPQSGGQNQQPPSGRNQQSPTNQSGGREQQSTGTHSGPDQQSTDNQSGSRTQQSPGTDQSTDRSQQASTNAQSGGQNQQPSDTAQSGGHGKQSSGTAQSGGHTQQSPTKQSGGRTQQSPTKQSTGDPKQQSTGGESANPSSEMAAHDQPPVEPPAVELTNANVSKFLAEELTQGDGDYGFDATLNVEGKVNRGRMTSDDIGETLETLLRWYARQTTDEVEPESVLGIILAGSDLAVEYPVQSVYTVVKRHDLKPDDSISDLLAAVRKEGSFTVPPSDE